MEAGRQLVAGDDQQPQPQVDQEQVDLDTWLRIRMAEIAEEKRLERNRKQRERRADARAGRRKGGLALRGKTAERMIGKAVCGA